MRLRIEVEGRVQGVGFRPFVYNLATTLNLSGFVKNTSAGATLEIEGSEFEVEEFLQRFSTQKPQNAIYKEVKIKELPEAGFDEFKIESSEASGEKKAHLMPDLSICANCLKELKEPKNRRFEYPFINCTDCGPRYSIIRSLPYDRANTSMSDFLMCPKCSKEYQNPKDRRFHAEPISCPKCGPTLMLRRKDGSIIATGMEAIKGAAKLIKREYILAIKGVGGFHLVCDASKHSSVSKLRERKKRVKKPFAVMIGSAIEVQKCTELSQAEEELLSSNERPIVLLKKRKPHRLEKFCIACDCIAPGIDRFGIFLPYSPIHKLLCDALKTPLVLTSANLSEEPLCVSFEEVCEKLGDVFDYVLDYDREIINPVDDSVAFVLDEKPVFIRRARGYAPDSITLPFRLDKKVLALGAQQKNTVAIAFDGGAILSPHIGDLDNLSTMDRFEKTIELLKRVYDFSPDVVVMDKHPSYSYRSLAKGLGLPLFEVQHHYAHALSVMCEHNLSEALALTWDGTGYGDDGTLWGGEFLSIDKKGYRRACSFEPFRLLGGESAIKEPKRVALSILFDLLGEDALDADFALLDSFKKDELKALLAMHKKGLNSPLSSSVGRLFDAVAAINCGIFESSYEGECGMALEAICDEGVLEHYEYEIKEGRVLYKKMLLEMLKEDSKMVATAKFFNTLSHIALDIAKKDERIAVFSGGVFQNRVLCEKIIKLFKEHKIEYRFHELVPPNDGGIALGQVAFCGLVA